MSCNQNVCYPQQCDLTLVLVGDPQKGNRFAVLGVSGASLVNTHSEYHRDWLNLVDCVHIVAAVQETIVRSVMLRE